MRYILYYLLTVNAAAFLLMLLDKQKAIHHRWRIPEAVLLGSAALGGSIGALLGMYFFRHKTKHKKFTLGVPAILIAQLCLALFLRQRMG